MSIFHEISIVDGYGWDVESTPMGELRAVSPVRLVGATFEGTTIDSNFWTVTTGATGASIIQSGGSLTISGGTSSTGVTAYQSVRTARYIGSASNRYRSQIVTSAAVSGNCRNWGAYNSTDGAFFQLSGTNVNVVTRRLGVDTVISSTGWTGDQTIPTFTNVNTYEIYYTNKSVYYTINDVVAHTATMITTPWSASKNLPIRAEIINAPSTVNTFLSTWVASIVRFGELETGSQYKFQSGTTAGVVAKYSSGTLHRIILGVPATNAVVTLYDGTSTAGNVMFSTGAFTANQPAIAFDMDKLQFFTGLFLVVSGAAVNVTLIYE